VESLKDINRRFERWPFVGAIHFELSTPSLDKPNASFEEAYLKPFSLERQILALSYSIVFFSYAKAEKEVKPILAHDPRNSSRKTEHKTNSTVA